MPSYVVGEIVKAERAPEVLIFTIHFILEKPHRKQAGRPLHL
jgi:hypothetical protein